MIQDRQGNALTGATAAAAAHYDAALEAFGLYRGDPVAELDAAIAAAPAFAMAELMRGWLMALATEPEAAREAAACARRAAALELDERAASHLAALQSLLAGDWNRAAVALDLHNARYPHDLLALQAGHLLDFFRGDARDLRDRIARVLPRWSADMPGHPTLLGMYAFGLEEMADYARAEAVGREAVERQPLDCWAHHAVAHVLEMQGRAADGIAWMTAREPYWSGDDNFFKVHNWWHRALYHLELGEAEEVLRLYDGPIRAARSAMAIDMIDASALLWRLDLAGIEVGDRWVELALAWDRHADGRLYPFNDWHAVMAYLGAGREDAVARVRESLRALAAGQGSETAGWAREIALPMVEGFVAFHRGAYARAVELLHPVRFRANRMGGSHAQRDIIDWTMTEAALRAGLRAVAAGFAAERLAVKPHSPVNRRFLERARALH
jgi:hypothetical protein